MRRTFLFSGISLLVATLFLCACNTATENIVGMEASASNKAANQSPSHPALTYIGLYSKSGGTSYMTVAVMDSDGTHQANVLIGPNSSGCTTLSLPRWSPTGGSIAYLEQYTCNPRTWRIKAVDVTINSSGTPVGSNPRTIYTSTTDSITGLAWCSVGGTARLAFTAQTTINGSPVAALYTVSQNGGAPTLVKTIADGVMKSPTWSPDDSKIGVLVNAYRTFNTQSFNWHLNVVNSGSGTILEDDALATLFSADNLEWARSGNTIAFDGRESASSSYAIRYIDYGSLTGPYTQSVPGRFPTWSPNSATIIFGKVDAKGSGLMQKINAFGTTVTTVLNPSPSLEFKWKR